MKKNFIKDVIACLIYILTFVVIYFILTKNEYLFASKTDYVTQHYVIPEYFRQLFYRTHNLFPDFAFHLGGGQNIYYLSYYGLLSPFTLLSYFFPNVSMLKFMIIANCIIVISCPILFYFYLKRNHYSYKVCFLTSFLFLCSSPLIFHAHRQVMFINYLPFLIMGFYGVDHYIEAKRPLLLAVSVSLLIYTSYYFSISAIFVLIIYLIYKGYFQKNKFNLQSFISFTKPFAYGILSSMVIIFPTFYVLLNGREHHSLLNIFDLLIPMNGFLYSPYSIGLTLISLLALIWLLFKGKKMDRLVVIGCFLFTMIPLFNYIFNGTLYINTKVLIPFMPFVLILVAKFLSYCFDRPWCFFLKMFTLIIISTSLLVCLIVNVYDELITKKEMYSVSNKAVEQLINEITANDQSFYRIGDDVSGNLGINRVINYHHYKTTIYSSTSNKYYSHFCFDVINNANAHRNRLIIDDVNNPLFQRLMNEKYIISRDNLPYTVVQNVGGIKLYRNNNVLPLGYISHNLINNADFKKIIYPDNVINMMNAIISGAKTNTELQKTKRLDVDMNKYLHDNDNLHITNDRGIYTVKSDNDTKLNIPLPKDLYNKMLFIRFNNSSDNPVDQIITINNVKNKLTAKGWKYHNQNNTFDYVIYNSSMLNITIPRGIYQISDLMVYEVENDVITSSIDTFTIETMENNYIEGTIDASLNGYFNLSIPYDKGFSIYVDNELIKYEKTNTSFIGFKIDKGYHNIYIVYHAPYKRLGLFLSILGVFLLLILSIKEFTKRYRN